MQPLNLVEPWYYNTVYFILFLFLSWGTVLYYIGSDQQKILRSEGSAMQGAVFDGGSYVLSGAKASFELVR